MNGTSKHRDFPIRRITVREHGCVYESYQLTAC